MASPVLYFLYHLISGAAASFTVVTLPGHIVLDSDTIRAKGAGTMSRMSVSQGDFVARGQILAVVLEPDLSAQHALLLDQLAAGSTSPVFTSSATGLTIERFNAAQSHLRVMQHLQAEGAATRAETQEAQNASDTIAADIARDRDASMRIKFDNGQAMIALRRKANLLKVRMQGSSVRAAISGQIVSVLVRTGEPVTNQEPLFRLISSKQPKVISTLSSADAGLATFGRKSMVIFPSRRRVSARVTGIVAQGASATGAPSTLKLTFTLDEAYPKGDLKMNQLPVTVELRRKP